MFRLLKNYCFSLISALISVTFLTGAELPTLGINLAFYPTQGGVPISGGVAFSRNYTLAGPEDNGPLLPGIRLERGAAFQHAAAGEAVYQYNPQTGSLSEMNTSSLLPALSSPVDVTYDSRRGRLVLVSNGGEGILYTYVVPDPIGVPQGGVWSFLASMENTDVASIAYHPASDSLYAVSLSANAAFRPRIYRLNADGTPAGEILLPELPFTIALDSYQAELISVADHLVLFLEPRETSTTPIRESRIYLINPATGEVQLTYSRPITPDVTAPVVQLLAPTSGLTIGENSPLLLRASAVDERGGVVTVDFILNGAVLGRASNATGERNDFVLDWTATARGSHTISARATDQSGNSATSASATITVTDGASIPDTTPPVVAMLAPANGVNVAFDANVFLAASASDPNGSIAFVDFLRNGTVIGRAANTPGEPAHYSLVWIASTAGTQNFAVRATDSAGNVTTSPVVSITVGNPSNPPDTTSPTVQLLAPANNSTVTLGSSLGLVASASDAQGTVAFVDFLRNGTMFARGTNVAGQANRFAIAWPANALGPQSFSARATDNFGNVATSASVTIEVISDGPAQDTTPPSVTLLAPRNNSTLGLGSNLVITATATDAQGSVAFVEFLRNGAIFARGTNTPETSEYYVVWPANSLGVQTFAARATDNSGNTSTTAAINVTVVNPPNNPPNLAPIVFMVSPTNNAEFALGPINLIAIATDPDGRVNKLEFLVNNHSVRSLSPSLGETNLRFTWTPQNPGVYKIAARATDHDGARTTSAQIQITVRAPNGGGESDRLSAVRKLPDRFQPGHPFAVEIDVRARTSNRWTVEETPPPGWRVIGISHGGRFNRDSGKITFGPFDKSSRTLKYHLISSRTNTGAFNFSGQISAGGEVAAITGDLQITAEGKKHKDKRVKIHKGKHGKIVLRFDPEDGIRWIVEFAESIRSKTWTPLPNATFTVNEDGEISIDDPDATGTHRFYRLRAVHDDRDSNRDDHERDGDDRDDNDRDDDDDDERDDD